jgi:hypothetical protein
LVVAKARKHGHGFSRIHTDSKRNKGWVCESPG